MNIKDMYVDILKYGGRIVGVKTTFKNIFEVGVKVDYRPDGKIAHTRTYLLGPSAKDAC